MKHFTLLPLLACVIALAASDELPVYAQTPEVKGTMVFSDDFSRDESQEDFDEVGNGWTTNGDKTWSKGKKQADLRDGHLYAIPANGTRSDLLVIRSCDFRDGSVVFRFRLHKASDEIGMVIADSQLKNVHAGHVMSMRLKNGELRLIDMLSGAFAPEIWKRKKAKKSTKADQRKIADSRKLIPAKIEVGRWHSARLSIVGSTATAYIDDVRLGSFSSPGFANAKTILRVSFKGAGAIDDFKLYSNP